jgi:asparagine synthase (glutamine-hydrolysing)
MCGIAGVVKSGADEPLIKSMLAQMLHRGPDDEGLFIHQGAAIGMRRLSIIDVAGSQQPIFNEDRSLAIVFNGEIYNFARIRRDLLSRGHILTTQGDTEVILHLFEERGPKALDVLEGMFAICILNLRNGDVFLARDRLGKKPLYYTTKYVPLAFSSELKSILAIPGFPRELHKPSLKGYLALRYVPGPETLISGIKKFPAAHYAWFRNGKLTLERYWAPLSRASDRVRSDQSWQEEFDQLFDDAVAKRMISERPVGSFLSGGLDSTAITAGMARHTGHPVKTFSVGFGWEGDELDDAAVVAKALGCDHHPFRVQPEDFSEFPNLIRALDEPIGDPIVLPMYLLAREARKYVTVILSGEGADEILAGYFPHRVMMMSKLYRRLIPGLLRTGVAIPAVATMPHRFLNLAFDYPAALGAAGKRKLIGFLRRVEESDDEALYRSLISLFDTDEVNLLLADPSQDVFETRDFEVRNFPYGQAKDALDQMLLLQYGHWLQDDILTKLDKTTMAHSIEGRNPFMDHKLVEFMLTVPSHLKLKGKQNKILLRRHLASKIDPEVSRRRKRAFYVPLDQFWKTEALRGMLERHLSDRAVKERGLFNPELVRRIRERSGRGEFVFDKQLFSLLAFELWMDQFIDNFSAL